MVRRFWTKAELKVLREGYGKEPPERIALRLGRTLLSIRQAAGAHGLTKKLCPAGVALSAFVLLKHPLGWCDNHIASAYSAKFRGCVPLDRHTVSDHRGRLQLGVNAQVRCPLCKDRVRRNTARQLQAAGVKSLGEVRVLAFRQYARRHGWPEDLRPRAVQILNALAVNGPMTKNQLAQAIGVRWQGLPSRKVLVSNDKEGSYLAHLMKRGLVIPLGRKYRKGYQWEMIYSLALTAERKVP